MREEEVEGLWIIKLLAHDPLVIGHVFEPAQLCALLDVDDDLDSDEHACKEQRADDARKEDGGEEHVWDEVGALLLDAHLTLEVLRRCEGVVLEDDRAREEHEQRKARGGGEVVVRCVLIRLCLELDQQEGCAYDRANGNLQDGPRLDNDKESDQEELAQHLGQLPPEGRRIVLAVQHADAAAKVGFFARNDGR